MRAQKSKAKHEKSPLPSASFFLSLLDLKVWGKICWSFVIIIQTNAALFPRHWSCNFATAVKNVILLVFCLVLAGSLVASCYLYHHRLCYFWLHCLLLAVSCVQCKPWIRYQYSQYCACLLSSCPLSPFPPFLLPVAASFTPNSQHPSPSPLTYLSLPQVINIHLVMRAFFFGHESVKWCYFVPEI